jgi:hypothetical protein
MLDDVQFGQLPNHVGGEDRGKPSLFMLRFHGALLPTRNTLFLTFTPELPY